MSEVELVDGNEVFHRQRIFLNVQQSRTAKINDAESVEAANHFSNAVIFRAGAVVNQITQLDVVLRTAIVWIDHRKSVESV